MRPIAFAFLVVIVLHAQDEGLISTASGRFAQSASAPCTPPAIEPPRGSIFNEAQEADLGDAIADGLMRDFRIIDDPAITTPLGEIGGRLIKNLPQSQLRFEFFVIEMADINAFVLPGGRIFVSTRLIGFADSEDELAGVMAHELGHLMARQQSIFVSRAFKRILNVEQVGDRADIFDKYHRLLDNAARNPSALAQSDSHENSDQVAADRLGLYLLAAAGYNPQAFARFFDRLANTKGQTGGFFSNLFGTTSPQVRRLREMVQATGALPAACVTQRTASDAGGYRSWQSTVVGYTGRGRKESIRGEVSRTRLNPPLRSEVQHLRFSPDGRHLLAQDDSGIIVLSRAPFAVLFRIDAVDATHVAFSPDSQSVVFLTADQRVETWSVADKSRRQRVDPFIRQTCLQTRLASNAATLACLDTDFTLTLFDAASGDVVVQRKAFYEPDLVMLFRLMSGVGPDLDDDSAFVNMGFSTDGRFFLAGYYKTNLINGMVVGDDVTFAFDMQTRTPVQLKTPARRLVGTGFVFTGPDRFIGVNRNELAKSGAVTLPGGDVAEQISLVRGDLSAPAKGPFLFVRPFQKYAVGVLDVAKGQIVKGTENPAIDIFGDVFVLERGSGELGLYDVSTNQLQTTAALPAGSLGRLRASAVSADFKWLAFSERSRGGIWDLATGRQVTQVRGFRGAWMDGTGELFADLAADRTAPRRLVRMNPADRSGATVMSIKPGSRAFVTGGAVVAARSSDTSGSAETSIVVEMKDARTAATLWTKTFEETLGIVGDPSTDATILMLDASGRVAREEARRTASLRTQLDALKETEGDQFLHILDTRTGAPRGGLFVETGKGSFRIRNASAAGDWVLVEDTANRTRVYSLSTGEQKGRVFGTRAVMSTRTGLMAVENGAGKLILYELPTLNRRSELTFSHPVSTVAFNADGTRLFVLTSDQTAFVLDVIVGARLASPQQ